MKKIFGLVAIALLGFGSIGQAALIDDAVSWMHTNGLTIFNNTRDYKPNNSIRRDEAAKLFVKFAELMEKAKYVTPVNQCIFDDRHQGHADLIDIMVQACRYGIFLGHNNKFMPTGILTNEQAVTVLVRILYGKQSESGVSNWSDNYYKKANENNLLRNVSMNNRGSGAMRGNVGNIIYSSTNINNGLNNNSGGSKEPVDCGLSRSPISDGSTPGYRECMNEKFLTCSPAVLNTEILDPSQNPFDSGPKNYFKARWEIIGYNQNKSNCNVNFTYIKSQFESWDNKSMICSFDIQQTFYDQTRGYYISKCQGELRDIMGT